MKESAKELERGREIEAEKEDEDEREATRKIKRTIEINSMRERIGSESTREKEKRRKK
jgi:hypothetical protein